MMVVRTATLMAVLWLVVCGREEVCRVRPLEVRNGLLGDTIVSGTLKSAHIKVRQGHSF